MNRTRKHGPRPPQDIEDRDWLAQERSLADPQPPRADALLARALRSQPVSQPPPGFAADVARLVAHRVAVADDGRLERMLLNALLVLMALGAVVATLLYGGQWLAMSRDAIGAAGTQWALAGAACVALSWAMGGMRRWLDAARTPAAA